jgi:hypothetical protein
MGGGGKRGHDGDGAPFLSGRGRSAGGATWW